MPRRSAENPSNLNFKIIGSERPTPGGFIPDSEEHRLAGSPTGDPSETPRTKSIRAYNKELIELSKEHPKLLRQQGIKNPYRFKKTPNGIEVSGTDSNTGKYKTVLIPDKE
jgi:hypothetical protein